eukprot:4437549-Karenia_brevis.AAC.1
MFLEVAFVRVSPCWLQVSGFSSLGSSCHSSMTGWLYELRASGSQGPLALASGGDGRRQSGRSR